MRQARGTSPPLVTIGLPVYNGEEYLEEALDGLLAQTFTDFELIISDNASTDRSPEICAEYAARDPRIRCVRQPVNVGAGPNHNLLVPLARGRFFKWAAHDDLYAPQLLERCVETLLHHPEVVLVNVWDAIVDEEGDVVDQPPYPLDSANPEPHKRLRSLLRADGGNDFYGVIRIEVLRQIRPHNSYHHADRTFMAELALAGPWRQVPEVLYFRRDHPGRATHAGTTRRFAVILDPRRANRRRHPVIRLYAEYVLGLLTAVLRAPLNWREKVRCFKEIAAWVGSRTQARRIIRLLTHDGQGSPGQGTPA